MASITVCGSVRSTTAPDRARVDLGLTYVAPTPTAALDELARRSQRLTAAIASVGITDREWTTQGITIGEEWEWKNDANTLVGHRATAGVTVIVGTPSVIADLLRVAVEEAGAQVRNLQWIVSDDNPLREQLLGAAALDARRRATAYSGALGLQLGGVEEISELPIGSGTTRNESAQPMMLRSAKSAIADLDVNGGEIELSASVFVRFTTLPLS